MYSKVFFADDPVFTAICVTDGRVTVDSKVHPFFTENKT